MAIWSAYNNKLLNRVGNIRWIGNPSLVNKTKAQPMKTISKVIQPIKQIGKAIPVKKIAPKIQTSNVAGKTIVRNASQQWLKPWYATKLKPVAPMVNSMPKTQPLKNQVKSMPKPIISAPKSMPKKR